MSRHVALRRMACDTVSTRIRCFLLARALACHSFYRLVMAQGLGFFFIFRLRFSDSPDDVLEYII